MDFLIFYYDAYQQCLQGKQPHTDLVSTMLWLNKKWLASFTRKDLQLTMQSKYTQHASYPHIPRIEVYLIHGTTLPQCLHCITHMFGLSKERPILGDHAKAHNFGLRGDNTPIKPR